MTGSRSDWCRRLLRRGLRARAALVQADRTADREMGRMPGQEAAGREAAGREVAVKDRDRTVVDLAVVKAADPVVVVEDKAVAPADLPHA